MDHRAPAARLPAAGPVRLLAVTVLTGIGAGVGGAALTLLLHGVQHLAYGYTETTFLVGVERASGSRRVLVLALAGVVAGLGWWWLRRGGGVPTVSEAARTPGVRLPLGRATLDACLQVVVVALGASLGREGAPRQLGAAVGAWLSDRGGLDPDERRVLLACGAGAGLAAVYDVPLGGALFTLEVLLVSAAVPDAVLALATSALATAVAWTVLPDEATYALPDAQLSGRLLAWSVPAGLLLGLAAAAFTRLTDAAAARRPTGRWLPLTTVPVFLALGVLAVAYPQLLGNGRGAAQLAFDGTLPWTTVAALVLLKPIATAACLRSGAAGGRLTPAVATGALLGALAGLAWLQLWPGGDVAPGRLAPYALVGATAFLAVTLRAPLTATALLLELTRTGTELLVPTLLATAGATLTARQLAARRPAAQLAARNRRS